MIKAEFDYRREIRRKLDRIQHDNRDQMRRHYANDHVFAHELLKKRHQWFVVDKTYRDACQTTWDKQVKQANRTSHFFVPNTYMPEEQSALKMSSFNNMNTDIDENSAIVAAKIQRDFLRKQPVMLEIIGAPHASKVLKTKQAVELRKQSAQQKHKNIQTTAINDKRYLKLVGSLQET